MRFLRNSGLAWFFLFLFAASLVGQALAGHAQYNDEEVAHAALLDEQPEELTFGRYVVSSHFWQAVMENWQSEYLQFTVFLIATIWFVQRGSAESKKVDDLGRGSDEEQKVGEHADASSPKWARVKGARLFLYENSLFILMLTIWLASWFGQSVAGWSEYNAEAREHAEGTVGWWGYLGTSDFWNTTLQNWQSEFLAVGSMAVLAIYLRQRGSPESKPVGAPHEATGVEG